MKLEKLFDCEIIQTEDIEMPEAAGGDLLVSPTSGGSFHGECLRGELLPEGFGTTRTRGPQNDIHSELMLRTDDDCDILMTMEAIFDVTPEIEAQLIAGRPVDPERYYYRGTVSFETGAPSYRWLQRKVCVAECVVEDYTKLHLSVYMVM